MVSKQRWHWPPGAAACPFSLSGQRRGEALGPSRVPFTTQTDNNGSVKRPLPQAAMVDKSGTEAQREGGTGSTLPTGHWFESGRVLPLRPPLLFLHGRNDLLTVRSLPAQSPPGSMILSPQTHRMLMAGLLKQPNTTRGESTAMDSYGRKQTRLGS